MNKYGIIFSDGIDRFDWIGLLSSAFIGGFIGFIISVIF